MEKNAAPSNQCSPTNKGIGYSRGGAYIYTSLNVFNMPMYCICIDAQVYVCNAYIQAIETRKYTW